MNVSTRPSQPLTRGGLLTPAEERSLREYAADLAMGAQQKQTRADVLSEARTAPRGSAFLWLTGAALAAAGLTYWRTEQ